VSVRFLSPIVALSLGVALLVSVAGPSTAEARPTAGLRNGGFDTTLRGWELTPTHRAKVSRTPAGRSGDALLIRKKSGKAVAVRATRRIDLAGQAGARYQLSAWVRASRTGQRVIANVRELRGAKVIRSAKRSVILRADAWTSIDTRLTRARAGTTFQVRFSLPRGKKGDRLAVDQVRLRRVQSAGTSGAGCFGGRGIPQCGPVLGSAYGSNTDPASFETSIGHTLGIRRTYWTASQVDSAVKAAAGDLADGRIPWISFKLPHSWEAMASGSGDAWAKDLATKLAALPGPVWIAFHHEPEGDGDITAWTAMQARLAPIVRTTAPNVAYTIVLTGWHQLYGDAQYHLDALWPKNTKVDIAGFDVYNSLGVVKDGVMNTKGTDLATAYFKPISAWANAHDVAWGIAETGYTDHASTIQPHWIQQTFAAMKTYGGVAFTYFNTTLNSIAPWTLGTPTKMADYAAAQATSPMWTR
jgi:hypothetical protein